MFEDSDEEEGTDDMIVRQAEGARAGGRMLCALKRYGGVGVGWGGVGWGGLGSLSSWCLSWCWRS